MAQRKGKKLPHIFREQEFLEWRDRILSWPAAIDEPNPPRIEDLPEEYQRDFIKRMLRYRRARKGPEDFSHRILEEEDA